MLRRIFDMDNPLMRGMTVAGNLLMLNLLTLACVIPIVTAGAAFTALNDVVIHIVRGEETYIIRSYFKSFKSNLKKGSVLGLIFLACTAFIWLDYRFALVFAPVLRIAPLAVGIILLALAIYAFALLSRYENTLKATLKNAASLMIAFFPRTLLMVVISAGLWLLAFRFILYAMPILLMFGFSMPCYICALLLNDVFRRLDGEDSED